MTTQTSETGTGESGGALKSYLRAHMREYGLLFALIAIMVFFPVLINVVRGLTEVEPNALELMRSYAASDFKILLALRVPNALPYLFSALRVASVLSMIGAIVADFFGAERNTLGKYVTQEAAVLRFENTWAAILVASLLGIMLYTIIVLLENWVTPWAEERRE